MATLPLWRLKMEDWTWKDILFVIVVTIVGGYFTYVASENYKEIVNAAKVINAQNQQRN